MKRRLFTTFAAVSLLICLTAGGFWVRSYVRDDLLAWNRDFGSVNLYSNPGRISFSTETLSSSGPALQWRHEPPVAELFSGRSQPTWSLGPISYEYSAGWLGEFRIIKFPHWLIVLLTAPPALLWLRHWRRHRHPAGRCQTCGYDLRAKRDRCPECGTTPAGAA